MVLLRPARNVNRWARAARSQGAGGQCWLIAAAGLWLAGTIVWWADVADPAYEVRHLGTYVFTLVPAVFCLLPLLSRAHRRLASVISFVGLGIWCVLGAYFGTFVYLPCLPCLTLAAVSSSSRRRLVPRKDGQVT
jgi:hypothetical protein